MGTKTRSLSASIRHAFCCQWLTRIGSMTNFYVIPLAVLLLFSAMSWCPDACAHYLYLNNGKVKLSTNQLFPLDDKYETILTFLNHLAAFVEYDERMQNLVWIRVLTGLYAELLKQFIWTLTLHF